MKEILKPKTIDPRKIPTISDSLCPQLKVPRKESLLSNAMPPHQCLHQSTNPPLFQLLLPTKLLLCFSLEGRGSKLTTPCFKTIPEHFSQISGLKVLIIHKGKQFSFLNSNEFYFSRPPFYRPPYQPNMNHQGDQNPFQNLFLKQSREDSSQQSSLFPLNINKMHVSLSGSSDGVSLTIETHQGQNKSQLSRNSTETSQVGNNNGITRCHERIMRKYILLLRASSNQIIEFSKKNIFRLSVIREGATLTIKDKMVISINQLR